MRLTLNVIIVLEENISRSANVPLQSTGNSLSVGGLISNEKATKLNDKSTFIYSLSYMIDNLNRMDMSFS